MRTKLGSVAGWMLIAAGFATAVASAQTTTWKIDPAHSEADFAVRHMGISTVHGHFGNVNGILVLNDADITKSTVTATVDTTTIDTGVAARDTHLKSADFFDVTKFPTMTFVGKQITKSGGKLEITGDLTLHGITKSVTLDADSPSKEQLDPYGMTRIGFSMTTSIHRQDFGLVWQGTLKSGDVAVGDDVKVELDVELIKQ
jgi:polyisoprenoid-binding protein YceI